MPPTKRDPEATRAAILEAAEEVFLAKGVGEASISAIARRAKVTKSLIHHHFHSKEGLWNEVKTRRLSEYFEQQMEMLKDAPADAELLRTSVEFYFRFLAKNPEVVRIFVWMYLERDENCSPLDKALHQAGVEKIRESQEAGFIRKDVDARFVLFSFLSLVSHWFQQREHFCADLEEMEPGPAMDEAYLTDMLKIYFEGVLPREDPREEPGDAS